MATALSKGSTEFLRGCFFESIKQCKTPTFANQWIMNVSMNNLGALTCENKHEI